MNTGKILVILWICTRVLFAQDSSAVFTDTSRVLLNLSAVKWNTDLSTKWQKKYTSRLLRQKDSSGLKQQLYDLGVKHQDQGYAGATLDSFQIQQDSLYVQYYRGKKYKYGDIKIEPFSPAMMQLSGFQSAQRKSEIFSVTGMEAGFTRVLRYYQDQGYPFARFYGGSTNFMLNTDSSEVKVHVQYQFDPGKLYRIDSILIEGKIRENPRFVKNLIRIHEGDIYKYSDISTIPTLMNNSIYYQQVKKPEEIFSEDGKVKLRIRAEMRKASRFDGMIGILPPVDSTAKLQLTGLLDFNLVSPFGMGEILALRFEQLPFSSQKLSVRYIQPWILGTPVRSELELNLHKQDSSFLNRFFKITPSYMINRYVSVKGWYRDRTSILISTSQYKNLKTLPPVLDSKEQTLGLGFEFERLDYRLNPSKGFVFKTDIGAGTRKIRRNPGLDSLDYSQIRLNYPSREIQLEVKYYFSPFKRNVILLANKTFRLDQVQYFRNDLVQIGGARSIRGFNENQFFARFYTFFTVEYRFLLDQNSNLFVFYDQAKIELREGDFRQELSPAGLGGGINFETRAGILNVTFATGKVGDIPFTPARPRVHFGILSMF